MGVTSAMVVFAIVWFLVLFCVLPQRILTQKETGKILEGTPSSAPADLDIKKKFLLIITGKGSNSKPNIHGKTLTIKSEIKNWLSDSFYADKVQYVSKALDRHGGEGAFKHQSFGLMMLGQMTGHTAA